MHSGPPAEEGALGSAPPGMSAERRAQRLQTWADRELRALLQSEDTAIVRAYVMGLARGIGFSAASPLGSHGSAPQARRHACDPSGTDPMTPDHWLSCEALAGPWMLMLRQAWWVGIAQADGASGASSRREQDAVAALRPFLQEHAEHFWHELRCASDGFVHDALAPNRCHAM